MDIYDAIKYIDDKISVLEDDLRHYTTVEPDRAKQILIGADLDNFKNIKSLLGELYERRKGGEEME